MCKAVASLDFYLRRVVSEEGGINNAVLTRIAAILAVLSLIGAAYEARRQDGGE